jgi:PiT family inorganic phosphate transporter
MSEPLLIYITVAIALLFDFMNGFHDAANSIATVVSTRVLQPLTAVVWAAFFNFVAFLIFGPKVAETVAEIVKIEPNTPAYVWIVVCGVIGGLVWDILTWWFGLPTSSSHALIGGLAGSALVFGGWQILRMKKIFIIVTFIFLSPLLGFIFGFLLMVALYWVLRKCRPGLLKKSFRRGQLISAALYSIGHGANDAQKTMGVILAVLIAGGMLPATTPLSLKHPDTIWIILSCQTAISLGTLFGGWRIVKTMGMKITKLKPMGGFTAEMASATSLFSATLLGVPVSTTHTITGAIIGVGSSTSSFSKVKWGVATKIIWAWIFTIPGAGLVSAFMFFLSQLFHQSLV